MGLVYVCLYTCMLGFFRLVSAHSMHGIGIFAPFNCLLVLLRAWEHVNSMDNLTTKKFIPTKNDKIADTSMVTIQSAQGLVRLLEGLIAQQSTFPKSFKATIPCGFFELNSNYIFEAHFKPLVCWFLLKCIVQILLMEEFLHQLIWRLSHYFRNFETSQVVSRISAINSIIQEYVH